MISANFLKRLPLRPMPIFVLTIGLLTALRVWIGSTLGLAPDEVYYWTWAEELRLTYGDHPPLVAWLIGAGSALLGDTALGIRASFMILGAMGIGIVYQIGRYSGLTASEAMFAAILSSILPVCSAAALLATPDTPLGFCWLVGILSLKLMENRARLGRHAWYLFGAALAFGFWSKFSALLLLPVLGVAVSQSPRERNDFSSRHLWISIGGASVAILAYLALDFRGESSAVFLQMDHLLGKLSSPSAGGGPAVVLTRLVELLSGQIGLVTPLVALCLFWGLRARAERRGDAALVAGIAVPLLATLASACFTHPEHNWAALGHPLIVVLAVKGAKTRPRKTAWFLGMGLSVGIIAAVIHLHAVRPFLPLPPNRDPVSRLHGWEDLQHISPDLLRQGGLLCDNYGMAAELSWQLRAESPRPVVASGDRPSPRPLPPGNWLLLDELEDWGQAVLPERCRAKEPQGTLFLKRKDGTPVRQIGIYQGVDCL